MKKIKRDLSGTQINNILIVSRAPDRTKVYWNCVCLLCGKQYEGRSDTIQNSISCGCHVNILRVKHGHCISGQKSRVYQIYMSMLGRCRDKTLLNYGGRGITVCASWRDSFENFLADMGEPPIGYQLDRIDNDGNYEPSNCRWTTVKVNANNTRRNIQIMYNKKQYTIAQLAEELNLCDESIRYHYHKRQNLLAWIERKLNAKET